MYGDPAWSHEAVRKLFHQIEDWRGDADIIYRGCNGRVYVAPNPNTPLAPTPLPGGPQRTYKFWVDLEKQEVMRVDLMLSADEDDKLKGTTFSFRYTYIDGIPLVLHSVIDENLLVGKKRVRVVTEHTYSNFRKFSVTATIVPAELSGKEEKTPD